MKTITSILCTVGCIIAIPINIVNIMENQNVNRSVVLLFLMLPGFIWSLIYLYKKYDW